MPVVQPEQPVAPWLPDLAANLPAVQVKHIVSCVVLENLPANQTKCQASYERSMRECCEPGSQAVHDCCRAVDEKKPCEQEEQVDCPALLWKKPGRQLIHADEPVWNCDLVPTGHCEQVTVPVKEV